MPEEPKQLWRTRLKAGQSGVSSAYLNQVTMDLAGQVLIVRGTEAKCRYIEYVDRITGQTVAHRQYPMD
jgi:hypothetical protein